MGYVGCHLSISDGYASMAGTAEKIGADTFAFFIRNPRGGAARKPSQEELAQFRRTDGKSASLVVHSAYTMNLCSDREDVRRKAIIMLKDDLVLMEQMPGNYYNFHPGSHMFQGIQAGTDFVADALNSVLDARQSTVVLLETMAGKGTELGRNFSELAAIFSKVVWQEKIGVCFDTCHVWDAGYDIRNDLDVVLAAFDSTIGLGRLKAIHLNDSLYGLGSRKDRHAKLGRGTIGLEALKRVVTHPALAGKPVIMETPCNLTEYQEEIAMVKGWLYEGGK
ncbi:MAG: deoxyribonuclease IV [Lachnospiraceae bacterium]|nr:deoxyribonuclease IV [Lachnospiraceae bacterium]